MQNMARSVRLAAIIPALFLAGLAMAQEKYKEPDSVTILDENGILANVVGNTIRGKTRGTRWSEYYLPNGTIKGIWGRDRYSGKWTVSGPVMCYDYAGSDDSDGCWTMSLAGDSITYFNLEGKMEGDPAKVHKGNSEGL